jgi:arylsulfatase A-like enzyme
VTSVHGDMHGSHGLFRKGWPHEESVRVPLLVRASRPPPAPGRPPVSLIELPALTAAWADGRGRPPARPPGRAGFPPLISMPSVVRLPDQCDRVWSGVRTAGRKLVLNADGSPWLFFDLEDDPLETRNLAGDPSRAGEIAELRLCGRAQVSR